MKLTDLETAALLEEFKADYLGHISKVHEKFMQFKDLPDSEAVKADDVARKYHFLNCLVASVEGTLEQNLALKVENQKLHDRLAFSDKHVNALADQIKPI